MFFKVCGLVVCSSKCASKLSFGNTSARVYDAGSVFARSVAVAKDAATPRLITERKMMMMTPSAAH